MRCFSTRKTPSVSDRGTNFLPAAAFVALLASGCGPGSVAEYDAFECVDSQTLCVTLEVPDSYAGTARELASMFYETPETNGPPSALLPAIEYPSVTPGEPYELSHEAIDIVGEYYVMFVLYDESGGTWLPETDVDYTAMTEAPIQLDGNPIELGVMDFVLAE